MKKQIKFFSIFVFVLLGLLQAAHAQSDDPITGFLIKIAEAKQLTDAGAKAIKVFAAKDDNGGSRYVMVGLDAGGEVMKMKFLINDGTGDCPPTCDFLPTKLNDAVLIEGKIAAGYVENYMKTYPDVENAVVICIESIAKVAEKFNYMKVTMTGKVKISGVKDDGGIPFLAPFSKDCNKAERSTL